MKNEIKEIFDKFDKVLENYELDKKIKSFTIDSICHLFPKEMITIRDYITNLQHTKEYLGEVLYEKDKELERLKEKIKHYEETTTFGDYVKEVNLLVDYKSRIEKALLIIEKQKKKMYKSRNKIAMFILIKLDNILNGKE